MPKEAYKRFVLVLGFFFAVIVFIINILRGHDLLHGAFNSVCVMLGSAFVLFHVLRCIGLVMLKFLREQAEQRDLAAADAEAEAAKGATRAGGG